MKSGKILFLSALIGVAMVDAADKADRDRQKHLDQERAAVESRIKEAVDKLKLQIQDVMDDTVDIIKQLSMDKAAVIKQDLNYKVSVVLSRTPQGAAKEREMLQFFLNKLTELNNDFVEEYMKLRVPRRSVKAVTFAE